MSKKTNVQTNLLGRHVALTDQNAEAARRYQATSKPGDSLLPWVSLEPGGGEVVAVFTDRDGELNITVATNHGFITLGAHWFKPTPPQD